MHAYPNPFLFELAAAPFLFGMFVCHMFDHAPVDERSTTALDYRSRLREMSVRRKLNAMPAVFEGKSVLLVDDSIVRGTTMSQIVDMVRRAGAAKVYLASASPPIRYPNVYGVDMPNRKEFVANGLTVEQVWPAASAGRMRAVARIQGCLPACFAPLLACCEPPSALWLACFPC
eukprot:350235-Chlamydomonas_euryale.AAC.5